MLPNALFIISLFTSLTLARVNDPRAVCKTGIYKTLIPKIAAIPEAKTYCKQKFPVNGKREEWLEERDPVATYGKKEDPTWKNLKKKGGQTLKQVCMCIQPPPVVSNSTFHHLPTHAV